MNRRGFLKLIGAAVAQASLPALPAPAAPKPSNWFHVGVDFGTKDMSVVTMFTGEIGQWTGMRIIRPVADQWAPEVLARVPAAPPLVFNTLKRAIDSTRGLAAQPKECIMKHLRKLDHTGDSEFKFDDTPATAAIRAEAAKAFDDMAGKGMVVNTKRPGGLPDQQIRSFDQVEDGAETILIKPVVAG